MENGVEPNDKNLHLYRCLNGLYLNDNEVHSVISDTVFTSTPFTLRPFIVISSPDILYLCEILKGLARAKIIKISVILFCLLNMTI